MEQGKKQKGLKVIYENSTAYSSLLGEVPFYRIWITLTKREREVVKLICKGSTNEEISKSLNITLATAKTHVHNVLKKFDVQSRQALRDVLAGSDFDSL